MSLKHNKTALITGASSGIGEALAYMLSKQAYNLVLTGRNSERLEQVAQTCLNYSEIQVKTITADLAKPNQSEILFQTIGQQNIHIDILVNNAAFGEYIDFSSMNDEHLLQMVQVNITALSQLTRLILPEMQKKASGKIIFIGSVYSFMPVPKQTLYGASKAFVKSLAMGLRAELAGSGITVSCICPGSTKTRFHERAGISGFSKFFAMSPEQVAQYAMKGINKNKAIIIPGWYNKLFVGLMYLLPTEFSLKVTQLIVYKLRKFSE